MEMPETELTATKRPVWNAQLWNAKSGKHSAAAGLVRN